MVDVLLDKELGDELKKSDRRKFKYIKELLKPYRKSIRKLRDPIIDIHEKRKVLQYCSGGRAFGVSRKCSYSIVKEEKNLIALFVA